MKLSRNLIIIIILLSIASCLSNKDGENIKVYTIDLKFDSVNYTDTSIVRKRIEIIDESEYEFYYIPGQDTTLKFIIGDTRDELKSIRCGNDTCEFISSRKYNLHGKEIEVLKFNLDDVNAADEEAYIYYINEIGLLAYYSYIWDLMFFLEYDETIGLKELMFSEDTKFFISKYKHQYISLTELDIYLLNKEKDLSDFKNFHIWQGGGQNECFVFDYFTNDEFEKRYFICEIEDTVYYKIIFTENQGKFKKLDLIGNDEYVSENLYEQFKEMKIDKLVYDFDDDVFFLTKDNYTLVRSDKSLDNKQRFSGYRAIDENWYYFDNYIDRQED